MNAPGTPVEERPPVLLIDSNTTSALNLAARLVERGFPTEVTTSCAIARSMAVAHHYETIVIVADFTRASNVEELVSRLSGFALRSRPP